MPPIQMNPAATDPPAYDHNKHDRPQRACGICDGSGRRSSSDRESRHNPYCPHCQGSGTVSMSDADMVRLVGVCFGCEKRECGDALEVRNRGACQCYCHVKMGSKR